MRTYVGDQEAVTASEFEELAYGSEPDEQLPEFFRELLFGRPGESDTARAVRLDAARGILADLASDAPELAAYAATLLDATPLIRRIVIRRPAWVEAAA